MNELIKIQVENNQHRVSARELYKGLEIAKRFSAWWKQNSTDFEEGFDFTSVPTSTVVGNGARKPLQDYLMTIDMAKELCMMSHSEKGKEIRKYFIEVEKRYVHNLKQQSLPQTPEEKLALTMQVATRLDKRVAQVEEDITYLKENSEIDSTQRFKLQKARNRKAIEVCGGKKSNFYLTPNASRKVFRQLEHDFKDQFMISRYEDLHKKDFAAAIDFIENWYPPYSLKREIDQANAQLGLSIL